MGMGLGGVNANFSVAMQQASASKGGQRSTPTFAHNHTWSSIDDMSKAFSKYGQEWRSVYSGEFANAGAEGNGKLSMEELDELLEEEFGGMGVQFVDSVDPQNPKEGRFEVHIDEKTRQRMAADSEYRAQVFSVIQIEMAGKDGYSVQTLAGVNNDRTTGLAMSMTEGDPLYEGVPHNAGGTSASKGIVAFSMSSDNSTGSARKGTKKSLLEQIKEAQEKKLEEKKEQEKRAAAKKEQQDRLELSIEAAEKRKSVMTEEAGAPNANAASAEEGESADGNVNVLA